MTDDAHGAPREGYYNDARDGELAVPGEECGVFGVYGHADAAYLSYYGLQALQHRGQESAGICVMGEDGFRYERGMGLAKDVFGREELERLRAPMAIGHVRYSTSGASRLGNAQPLVFRYRGGDLAVATNGNVTNARTLRRRLEAEGSIFQSTSDTEVLAHLIARSRQPDVESAVREALNQLRGAFALLVLTNDRLIAAQDPTGFRPFSMGTLGEATVFASETCAFDTIGAEHVRDVRPGEMIVVDADGLREEGFAAPGRRGVCTMEYIYLARPDSQIDGINLHTARKNLGRSLAQEAPVEADVVTGVPDSSISAAIGFAEQSGIPYELGLIKNRYTGRTFIEPSQALRDQGVKIKLSAVRKVVEGQRVVMVDDSLVRGTTSLRIVTMLRAAGAREVHVRITSPPFRNPCYFGIDTPRRRDLIAANLGVDEIRERIEADSLHFLSAAAMVQAIGREAGRDPDRGHCLGCFTNAYPAPTEAEAEQEEAHPSEAAP